MKENENGIEVAITSVIVQTHNVAIGENDKAQIIETLSNVRDRIADYADIADTIKVLTKQDADGAAAVVKKMKQDEKAVCDVLEARISLLNAAHKGFTGLRKLFTDPLAVHARTIKDKVIEWEGEEQRKAIEAQRKMQAEADEAARKEREKLEAAAAKAKNPEVAAEKLEAAAAVSAPVIQVQAQKSDMGTRKIWVAEVKDSPAFFKAIVSDSTLEGYVTIEMTRMVRAKQANPLTEIPGVVFRQVTR